MIYPAFRPPEFKGFSEAVAAGEDQDLVLKQAFSMGRSSVNDYLLLGDVTMKVQGRLTFDKDKNWTFNGEYKVFDDTYDFNKSTRWFGGEWLTSLGRATPGKDFPIEIRGSVPVTMTSKHADDEMPIYVGP